LGKVRQISRSKLARVAPAGRKRRNSKKKEKKARRAWRRAGDGAVADGAVFSIKENPGNTRSVEPQKASRERGEKERKKETTQGRKERERCAQRSKGSLLAAQMGGLGQAGAGGGRKKEKGSKEEKAVPKKPCSSERETEVSKKFSCLRPYLRGIAHEEPRLGKRSCPGKEDWEGELTGDAVVVR